jgi:hypothetical protein
MHGISALIKEALERCLVLSIGGGHSKKASDTKYEASCYQTLKLLAP